MSSFLFNLDFLLVYLTLLVLRKKNKQTHRLLFLQLFITQFKVLIIKILRHMLYFKVVGSLLKGYFEKYLMLYYELTSPLRCEF